MNLLLSRCLSQIFFPFEVVSVDCFLKAGHDQKYSSDDNIPTNSNPPSLAPREREGRSGRAQLCPESLPCARHCPNTCF